MAAKQPELVAWFLETGFRVLAEPAASAHVYYDEQLLDDFKVSPYQTLFHFGFRTKNDHMSPSLAFLHGIATAFLESVAKDADMEITRRVAALSGEKTVELLHTVPFTIGLEHVSGGWLSAVWQELSAIFAAEIDGFFGSASDYLTSRNANLHVVGRVFFHLVENKDEEYPFAFLATYSTQGDNKGKAAHVPLKNALLEFKGQNDTLLALLSAVSRAADRSELISALVESGELFSPLKFTSSEAYAFLKEIPLYEESGILCRIPHWWKRKTGVIRLNISVGERPPSNLGMEALLSFDPELALGDERITKEEIGALLAQTAGLSLLKGRWVEVDHDKLQATLSAFEQAESLAQSGSLTLAEAMRMQLDIPSVLGTVENAVEVQVTSGQWLSSVRNRLLSPGELQQLDAGANFTATLRQYQQQGFDWLGLMRSLGFGALLADDMGLGKTVQVIALLEYIRARQSDAKVLLILPASLLGNWQKELEKFAPGIPYALLHGSTDAFDPANPGDAMVYLTTYGTAMRQESLRQMQWELVILDEAQAIKNPSAKQTKAVKQIPAKGRIAMTGTPVENRLSDLWSLFDFLNAGLLGSAKEFTAFAKRLKEQGTGYAKLRAVISPFILRRLKTDKSIISDLPDKLEMRDYASLTKKQTVLYNSLVKELKSTLEVVQEGIQRKGIVLASIMKFKQICNHPDQYLGQEKYDSAHSGKFELLGEICETIREKRERVLVFTQFKEMTAPLAAYLETVFGRPGLVLHGGTPVKKRGELVERFNGDEYIPFMVLSLKAGGVGLNLTAANHVVHFDRWWNPAVENQATDRAFRIGQQKNVMVHKFITKGTIEERIDGMIAEKQKLAGELTPGSGEAWITELSNEQLMELFTMI